MAPTVHVLEEVDDIIVSHLQIIDRVMRQFGLKQEAELTRAHCVRPVEIARVVQEDRVTR